MRTQIENQEELVKYKLLTCLNKPNATVHLLKGL